MNPDELAIAVADLKLQVADLKANPFSGLLADANMQADIFRVLQTLIGVRYTTTQPTWTPTKETELWVYKDGSGNYWLYAWADGAWRSNQLGSGAVLPTGGIIPYGGSSAPSGFLLCDGSAVSRTTYAALFAIIGTTFGVGDGSTTFNLPDMRTNVPVGFKSGDADFGTLGGTTGEKKHALTAGENGPHAHGLTGVKGNGGSFDNPYFQGVSNAAGGTAPNPTDSAGSGTPHNNIQPSLVVNFVIKT